MGKIKIIIDGHSVEVEEGTSVLSAALEAGIYIPHLCHHPSLPPAGECKLCVVHVNGGSSMETSCKLTAEDGMVIDTQSADLKEARCLSVELMLANHPEDCTTCTKYLKCELQSIKQLLGVSDERLRKGAINNYKSDANPLINRELGRCILCGRCVRACGEKRGVKAIDFVTENGVTSVMPVSGNGSLADSGCRFCGACVEVCPTGALLDKPEVMALFEKKEEAVVPCRAKCPVGTDVPRYLSLVREEKYDEALGVIRERTPFPFSLGYVCMRFCEDVCKRDSVNCAINIRGIKKIAAENGGDKWKEYAKTAPDTGKKAAVIGAGPAGLTAAYYLRRKGHDVTVFEKLEKPGGMLSVGIPKDRLPDDVVMGEVNDILETGVKLELGKAANPKELLDAGFDAVIAAVGAHRGGRLPIEGSTGENVLTGTEFLRAFALGNPQKVGKRVLVIGGGNVACDVAHTAIKCGAETISMTCLEARDKMTASADELEPLLEHGMNLYNARTFNKITDIGTGLSVECEEVESLGTDENGAFQINKKPDSVHTLEADTVIFATGQVPDLDESFGLTLGRGNRIAANETMTSVAGVFACGDAVTGTASIVQAVAGGREAAEKADIFLGGDGDITEVLAPETEFDDYLGRIEDFASLERAEELCSTDCAVSEAERCLRCHLRLNIERVPFWNEYSVKTGVAK